MSWACSRPPRRQSPVLDKLNATIAGIMGSPEGREFVTSRGNDLASDMSAAAYAAYIVKDNERFKKVVEEVGYQKQ